MNSLIIQSESTDGSLPTWCLDAIEGFWGNLVEKPTLSTEVVHDLKMDPDTFDEMMEALFEASGVVITKNYSQHFPSFFSPLGIDLEITKKLRKSVYGSLTLGDIINDIQEAQRA